MITIIIENEDFWISGFGLVMYITNILSIPDGVTVLYFCLDRISLTSQYIRKSLTLLGIILLVWVVVGNGEE